MVKDTVIDGVDVGGGRGLGLEVLDVSVSENTLLSKHPLGQLLSKLLVSRLNARLLSIIGVLHQFITIMSLSS